MMPGGAAPANFIGMAPGADLPGGGRPAGPGGMMPGAPGGMPGMGDEMEGAMQHAPQPMRQSI